MFGDCHIHMILDGVYYRAAIDAQKEQVDEALVRARLAAYRDAGIRFLRDGGDAWGVGSDIHEYADQDYYDKREVLARINDFKKVLCKETSEYLSEPVSLDQSGDVTYW